MKKLVWIFCSAILFVSFTFVNHYIELPKEWPKPKYDFSKNPITPEKVTLGRILFYDPILSQNNQISCASCHSPYNAFTHIDHALSHGINDSIGTRNSPALMNLAWHPLFMWDGAVNHLDVQALAPISHPKEMGSDFATVIKKLQDKKKYKQLFFNAFGDSIITGEHTLKSLSQFMLTIISNNSKYDKVMRKEDGAIFNTNETNGYQLFKKHCSSCHTEPLFSNFKFENNGIEPDSILNDQGRFLVTKNKQDLYKFKVPSLRNCELTSPYMHDGRYRNLQMVIFHYTNTVKQSVTLSSQLLKKIELNENQKNDLIAFLKTLTDEKFINNNNYKFLK